jgi:hypothetical protein
MRFEVVPAADEDAPEGEEGLIDVGAAFVADGQATKPMKDEARRGAAR